MKKTKTAAKVIAKGKIIRRKRGEVITVTNLLGKKIKTSDKQLVKHILRAKGEGVKKMLTVNGKIWNYKGNTYEVTLAWREGSACEPIQMAVERALIMNIVKEENTPAVKKTLAEFCRNDEDTIKFPVNDPESRPNRIPQIVGEYMKIVKG